MTSSINENELPDESIAHSQDPLYMGALSIVLEHELASVSLVQRHLRLGYGQTLGIFKAMEVSGVIGCEIEPDGFRKILLDDESRLKMLESIRRMDRNDDQ